MNTKSKAVITLLLAGAVTTVLTIQTKNSNLFKGQLIANPEEKSQENQSTLEPASLLPDLTAEISATMPLNPADDIIANVTIKNNGPGVIDGTNPFKYILSINGTEVMSNTDSYTTMQPGDSFSFSYPISRAIYNYKNLGKLKFIIDSENTVKEIDENNNMQETDY